LVDRVGRLHWPVAQSARAAGVCRQTAHKWLNRFRESGAKGLQDRSCRPKRLPSRTAPKLVRRMVQLRRRRKTGWEIAQELDVLHLVQALSGRRPEALEERTPRPRARLESDSESKAMSLGWGDGRLEGDMGLSPMASRHPTRASNPRTRVQMLREPEVCPARSLAKVGYLPAPPCSVSRASWLGRTGANAENAR